MKTVKVGLLGLGNVGSGTYKILDENRAIIEKRIGKNIEVVKILQRNPNKKRLVNINDYMTTQNPDDILLDSEIDIVVEAIGGIEPATTLSLIHISMLLISHIAELNLSLRYLLSSASSVACCVSLL